MFRCVSCFALELLLDSLGESERAHSRVFLVGWEVQLLGSGGLGGVHRFG